ncbi:hypothetical protein [Gimesia chilikensis]|uniref:hypothetical protein n=1 Tax=Gimesia chilikensis TaxID=2605989 RepID=UPI00118792B9|nr:hypothetical protein [Gimesia chilikensis]QDT88283.1 hypothetical protein MalM14_59800 [Gimesia chilikensis]
MDKPSPDQRATELAERLTPPCEYDQETGMIEFWSGVTTLSRDEKSRSGIGKILFEIAPKPDVIFEFECDEKRSPADLINSMFNTDTSGIYEMSCGQPVGAVTVNVTSVNNNKTGSSFSGHVVDHIDPDPLFDSIKYLVINGPDLNGKVIQGSDSIYMGRTETNIDGFEIVIDQIKEKKKNARTPFVFTHVIEVRFNKSISNPKIDLIGSILHKTLSFMCGRWVGLIGPWGYSETGSLNRVFPQVTMTSMNPPGLSWYYSMVKGTFEELFRCLYQAFNEPKRYEVLTTGIGWYVEAEQSAGLIEGSIVLQQAALETLAWFEVVEQRELCSVNGFKSLPASDKIRLLLSLYSIPTGLPAKSTELIAYAKEFNLDDLICVLVDVRNALVHGMPKKVEKLLSRSTGSDERVDLWYQVNGLLAQAILATAGYQGKISCRSLDVEFIHSAIKDVPWKRD